MSKQDVSLLLTPCTKSSTEPVLDGEKHLKMESWHCHQGFAFQQRCHCTFDADMVTLRKTLVISEISISIPFCDD